MRPLKTAGEVIEALGGEGALAEKYALNYATVWCWKTRGRIPAAYYLALLAQLEPHGLTLDPYQVFGMKRAPRRKAQ